jgi:hypothetical protein
MHCQAEIRSTSSLILAMANIVPVIPFRLIVRGAARSRRAAGRATR